MQISIYSKKIIIKYTGLSPYLVIFSKIFYLTYKNFLRSNPHSLATTNGISVDFFLPLVTKMFQFTKF